MKKYIEKINYGILLIIIGSIIGFIIENIRTCIIKDHCILRQGLIYGPFIPVYGAGLLILFLIYNRKIFDNKKVIIKIIIAFIAGFLLGSIIEFIFSYAQEKIFGTISWSYKHLKYNLYGRISLKHASLWGLLGVIFAIFLLPLINKLRVKIQNKKVQIVLTIISILFIIDIVISSVACIRAKERRDNLPPSNFVDKLCDKFYPDEYLNKIYTNAKVK